MSPALGALMILQSGCRVPSGLPDPDSPLALVRSPREVRADPTRSQLAHRASVKAAQSSPLLVLLHCRSRGAPTGLSLLPA